MTATYTAHHLLARSERRMVEYDVDNAENVVDLGMPQGAGNKCLPIEGFRRFCAGAFHSVGTGGITTLKIIGATAADGTGATAVVTLTPTTNDAVGDTSWGECTVEQIREVLPTATHVGLQVDLVTTTDEIVFFFERAEPEFPRANLTADYIS